MGDRSHEPERPPRSARATAVLAGLASAGIGVVLAADVIFVAWAIHQAAKAGGLP